VGRIAAGRLRWWDIEVAQKRPLWLEVRVEGRGGHASALNPASAAHELVRALARLVDLPQVYRVSPPARAYLAAIAPLHESPHYRRVFGDIDAFMRPSGPTEVMLPAYLRLFVDSVQVTVLEASESINVVSPEARALVDARLLPDTDADAFLARLRETLGKEVEVEVRLTAPPATASPTDHPAWRALAAGFGPTTPAVPALSAGFTDSRHLRERGIPAYGVTPFALEGTEMARIHAANERLSLAELDRGVERMRRIVAEFVIRPSP
jgi:acetylornithine deacetylase/succinyl-diaminopimelate desuccinylase-like protein